MRIKSGYMLRSVAGQNVVVPVGSAAIDFNGMISLNESGAFLWQAMAQDTTEAKLVEAILAEYEVAKDAAMADVAAFVKKMREANLLDE